MNKVVSVLATTDDPAAPGTKVLDNTLIYLFSEIGDGQDHTRISYIDYPQTPDYLPLVTIGKCGGAIKSGQVVQFPIAAKEKASPNRTAADLYLTMARAMGAKHLDSGIRDIYGLEKVTAQTIDEDVAVYTEYEFGLPPEPDCNLPLFVCDDPHGNLRYLEAARSQNHTFFSTGVFSNDCDAQVCKFPELSGCDGSEPQDACE